MKLLQKQTGPRPWPSPNTGSPDPSLTLDRPLPTIAHCSLGPRSELPTYTQRHAHTRALEKVCTDSVDVSTSVTCRSHSGLSRRAHTAVTWAHSHPTNTRARPSHTGPVPVTHPQNSRGPHIAPRVHAHKGGTQMHTPLKHTYSNGSECAQMLLPHPKDPTHTHTHTDHCPSTFHLGKTRPRLAPSALSPPWLKTGPALPAPACLGGAPPAPSASCQLSRGHCALCYWLPLLHVAGPTPSSWACHLSIWDPAWAPPSPFLQAVGKVPAPQNRGPGGRACWQDPRGKGQPSRASHHYPLVPSSSD